MSAGPGPAAVHATAVCRLHIAAMFQPDTHCLRVGWPASHGCIVYLRSNFRTKMLERDSRLLYTQCVKDSSRSHLFPGRSIIAGTNFGENKKKKRKREGRMSDVRDVGLHCCVFLLCVCTTG